MYNKLFTKILDSSIWLEPLATRIVWITLIATMDEDGYCHFSAIENLARRAGVDIEECNAAVTILLSPDANSGDPEHEGRRIERVPGGFMVLNSEKHRDAVTREKRREQTKNRVKKYRERHSNNGNVTQCNENVTLSEAVSHTESGSNSEDLLSRKVLNYLNEKTGKKFQAVNGSLKFITSRLKEGATEDQCRAVIDLKCSKWLNDPKWSEFLRPKTLFNAENFSNYVGEIGAEKPKTESIGDSWARAKLEHDKKLNEAKNSN